MVLLFGPGIEIVVRVLEIVALLLALETSNHGHQLAGFVVHDAVNRDVALPEVPKGSPLDHPFRNVECDLRRECWRRSKNAAPLAR